MKIALIATEKLPVPAVRGGAIQIYLDAISPLLAKTHQVTVFSITDPSLSERENSNGVTYIRIPEEFYLERLCEELKAGLFDVVHLCNRPNWIKSLKAASPSTKFVLSVHNEMFAPSKISDQEGVECVNLVEKIITVSDFIGNTITSRFPIAKTKTKTLYSGVDLQKYIPAWTEEGKQIRNRFRQELGLEGKKVVLFVGRLSKVKGPHILLQALPKIIAEHPNVSMVFVGSKWFGSNDINNYVKHLYTFGALYKDHATFVKFMKPADIPKLYTMSDLFVCSSQWEEPLARVHYEAMAAGLPVLTSNRGGNPEVIDEGKNGHVIYQFDNADQYAQKINELLSNTSLREKMGRYGRSYVERDFGWSRVIANLQQVYHDAYQSTKGVNTNGATKRK